MNDMLNQWKASEANARANLIAAAPDLLMACKDALKQFAEKEGFRDTSFLEAVVAKAEGRQWP